MLTYIHGGAFVLGKMCVDPGYYLRLKGDALQDSLKGAY
jgi:hypothetical protein